MIVVKFAIDLSDDDTIFVMGMSYQSRDKNRCSCSC